MTQNGARNRLPGGGREGRSSQGLRPEHFDERDFEIGRRGATMNIRAKRSAAKDVQPLSLGAALTIEDLARKINEILEAS